MGNRQITFPGIAKPELGAPPLHREGKGLPLEERVRARAYTASERWLAEFGLAERPGIDMKSPVKPDRTL